MRMLYFIFLGITLTSVSSIAQENTAIINPFRIDIDPMERLLLVNFENDPDTLYIGFEPQVFNDTINGRGHLILGWRQDGKVDVFHEPGLKPDPDKYDIAGKGLNNMIERALPGAIFEINEFGVQAYYEFQDIHGRTVVISINENNPKKSKPFGLLAPMGAAAENPSAMPLVLLHDFYFVRKKHTVMEVSIDGKQHKPDQLPIPMDWTKMSFIRYSPLPLIATLNPAYDGELTYIDVEKGEKNIRSGDYIFEFEWKDDLPSIRRIVRNNQTHPIELRFTSGFPDIKSLSDNVSLSGKFEIEGHPSTGKIIGEYTVGKKDDRITITMHPSKGWKPRPTKLSLRFLYTVAKIFRQWPTTYEWTAHIHEGDDGRYNMKSNWVRITD